MHFGFTDAQQRLRQSVADLLGRLSPPAAVRRAMESPAGVDLDLWRAMAGRDLLGKRNFVEVAIVAEALGAALACVPFLSTAVLAAAVLDAEADDIAAGRVLATVALADHAGRWDRPGTGVAASRTAGGWVLHGHASYVLDATVADVLVVAAGDGLYRVDAGAPGLACSPLPTVDRTRRLARLELTATPARRLAAGPDARALLGRALDLATVALAAEQVGGAQRCLDLAIAHVCAREQFGRPLACLQAVQHTLADMLVDVESARSAAYYAAWAATASPQELAVAAPVAGACCSEAYARVAGEALHLHGALGFTWDHDIQLWFKRARSSRLLLGEPAAARERLAAALGLPPPQG